MSQPNPTELADHGHDHRLDSGDRVQIAHGSDSLLLIVDHDGHKLAALLTPAEASRIGMSLTLRSAVVAASQIVDAIDEAWSTSSAPDDGGDETGLEEE